MNYKEARIYRIKYESLLSTALMHIYDYFANVILEATKQITEPETSANLLSADTSHNDPSIETAFSLYYGKFQSAACKVETSLKHVEERINKHNQ